MTFPSETDDVEESGGQDRDCAGSSEHESNTCSSVGDFQPGASQRQNSPSRRESARLVLAGI